MITKRLKDEGGAALILVMGMISVLTIVAVTALTYAVEVAPRTARDEHWQAALAAAQAGVDDYLAKLNRNDAYAQTVDCANVALKGPKAETNSCGWNAGTAPGWATVKPGDADNLIIEAFARPREGRRYSLGFLPAIPIEVVP